MADDTTLLSRIAAMLDLQPDADEMAVMAALKAAMKTALRTGRHA